MASPWCLRRPPSSRQRRTTSSTLTSRWTFVSTATRRVRWERREGSATPRRTAWTGASCSAVGEATGDEGSPRGRTVDASSTGAVRSRVTLASSQRRFTRVDKPNYWLVPPPQEKHISQPISTTDRSPHNSYSHNVV